MNTNKIEKRIELKAPISRVWRALTDYREFGDWFKVKLENPFVVGELSRGQITHPGYEHIRWVALVKKMDHEKLFTFAWPHSSEPGADPASEQSNLVEFHLEKTKTGTLLTIIESGFDKMPEAKRLEAYRSNDGGWAQQTKNIERHVAEKP